ncbi:MAG TPA: type II toxin-antitoxin system RelE/ParE family toxin [Bryobacteraceae bacterium]
MDFKVFYTPRALSDLEEIMRWSWDNHPDSSERFAGALLGYVELLKSFPVDVFAPASAGSSNA